MGEGGVCGPGEATGVLGAALARSVEAAVDGDDAFVTVTVKFCGEFDATVLGALGLEGRTSRSRSVGGVPCL